MNKKLLWYNFFIDFTKFKILSFLKISEIKIKKLKLKQNYSADEFIK